MSLTSLHIRDFAIIAALDIDFSAGFTVFSGETGAGKSILFDALGLALGDRADSSVIRSGAARTEVTACFDLGELPAVRDWLAARELLDPDEPNELQLRRQLKSQGPGRAYINGSPANLSLLRELSEQLIDIHGQHAHQSLLRAGEQRRLLDAYAGLEAETDVLAGICRELQEIRRQRQQLSGGGEELRQRQDLLRYQLEELDELQPEAADLEQLEADYRRQSEAENLLQQAATASNLLYAGDDSIYDQLQRALQALNEANEIDPRFSEALQLCEQAQISLKEAAQSSDALAADIDPDPETLAQLSRRLDGYQSLARKHRVSPADLPAHWQALREELASLEGSARSEEELQAREKQLLEAYHQAAKALSKQRQAAATKLGQAITRTVQPLGLPHARCEIAVDYRPEGSPQAAGLDQIEFRVAMNPGQPAAPLAKVASGGELARTSLAIQVVCLDQSPVPVLLFDEVDVGIGGGVAEVVGRRLRQLAERYQVFCVTHQPQVAALADSHFGVSKQVEAGQTETRITALTETARVEELARMLGGVKITAQTRSHAEEMLELAQGPGTD